jgi:predicted ATPase
MAFLKSIYTIPELINHDTYPFTIPLFSQEFHYDFRSTVTLFVGENGSGKSTLLEAIASKCDFHAGGGGRNQRYHHHQSESPLADALRLSWSPKVTEGFFLRAESFYNFATYFDEIAQDDLRIYDRYGGKSLHEQSHGESFLSLFVHRFTRGLFILDEPEAALSPQRQLAFMRIIHQLTATGRAQFIIANIHRCCFAIRVLMLSVRTVQHCAQSTIATVNTIVSHQLFWRILIATFVIYLKINQVLLPSNLAVLWYTKPHQKNSSGGVYLGSGERIRTTDLRVMSPTSCHCSTPRHISSIE